MSRGRVDAADLDPLFADSEPVTESWRTRPEEPRVETPAQHTVFIVVESTDEWDRTWWIVQNHDTKRQAIRQAEDIGRILAQELGVTIDKLED